MTQKNTTKTTKDSSTIRTFPLRVSSNRDTILRLYCTIIKSTQKICSRISITNNPTWALLKQAKLSTKCKILLITTCLITRTTITSTRILTIILRPRPLSPNSISLLSLLTIRPCISNIIEILQDTTNRFTHRSPSKKKKTLRRSMR